MADTIQIKGGVGDVPPLQDRELGYSKEEKALYIGTNNTTEGNVKLCTAGSEEEVFYAQYNTSNFSQIKGAYDSGKIVACKYPDGSVFWLSYASATRFVFVKMPSDLNLTFYIVEINNKDEWKNETFSATNKTLFENTISNFSNIEARVKNLEDFVYPQS